MGIVSIYFASPMIRENYIHHNGIGVVVRDDAKAIILRNNIKYNALVGITVTTNSKARIVTNSVTRNGTVGINVDQNSIVELYKNSISENGAEAIYFKNSSQGVVDSNEASGNLPNIIQFSTARVRISNNNFYSEESPGRNTMVLKNTKAIMGNNEVVGGIETTKSEIFYLNKDELIYNLGLEPFWDSPGGLPIEFLPPFTPEEDIKEEKEEEIPEDMEEVFKSFKVKGCLGFGGAPAPFTPEVIEEEGDKEIAAEEKSEKDAAKTKEPVGMFDNILRYFSF